MIERLLKGSYEHVKLYHARMAFSKGMDEVGRFKIGKVFSLGVLVLKILYLRLRHNIPVVYYPPSPPERVPVYRDLLILLAIRRCFEKIVFHFHAGGVSELYASLSVPTRFFFRKAYYGADAAIRLSEFSPPDGRDLFAKREFIVPYGIEDHGADAPSADNAPSHLSEILFVGVLRESKGVHVLLDACRRLHDRGLTFKLNFMGEVQDDSVKEEMLDAIDRDGTKSMVTFLGKLTGPEKWRAFARADVFCFPTFFEGESLPVVILEAMQFSLPVVATRWRGIPSMVRDGETGYLVPIRDSQSVAEKLEFLIRNADVRRALGERGRERFTEEYRLERFYENIEKVFLSVSGSMY